MYFFSGEATCLKVMPDCAVISVKAIFGGGRSHRIANKRYAFITSGDRIHKMEILLENGLVPFRSRFFFKLPGDLELALAFGFSPCGYVSTAKLVMHMGLIGFQAGRDFETLNTAFNIALLQQRFSKFVMRIGEVGLVAN